MTSINLIAFTTLKNNLIKYKNTDESRFKIELTHLAFLLDKKKFENNNQVLNFIIELYQEKIISLNEKDYLIEKYNNPNKI